MPTITVKGSIRSSEGEPLDFEFGGMWIDTTAPCARCHSTGLMCVRTGYHLLDLAFVRCDQCKGSGVTGTVQFIG